MISGLEETVEIVVDDGVHSGIFDAGDILPVEEDVPAPPELPIPVVWTEG